MKMLHIAVMCMSAMSLAGDGYKAEFKQFERSDRYKMIFNEDSNGQLRTIERDIVNYSELTYFQRLVRFAFFGLDVVVVTADTMPKLWGFIDGMCQEQGLATPTIFLTREKGFFNAAAQKLLMSSGAIVIGQKLMMDVSDEELEAVVAHEIGHIKYNHVNKLMATMIAAYAVTQLAVTYGLSDDHPRLKEWLPTVAVLAAPILIGKRFEKEADAFAYKTMGKGKGLASFFENLIAKDKAYQADFETTYNHLRDCKCAVSTSDRVSLWLRYYLAKGGNMVWNGYKWIYYNTPYGPHPSPEARIETIKEHMEATPVAA